VVISVMYFSILRF